MRTYRLLVVRSANDVDRWFCGYNGIYTEYVRIECEAGTLEVGDRIARRMYIVAIEEI